MPGGKGPTGPWHYVDIGLFEGPSHIGERCSSGDCVSQKIDDLIGNLKAGKDLVVLNKTGMKVAVFTPPKELRFLVHFLGDIHQPLHCATNADAGGNCIKEKGYALRFPELHAVWDTALVDENINKGPATAGAIIHEFDGNFTVPAVNGPNAIAAESFEMAKKVYHDGKPTIPVINHFVEGVSPSNCATTAPPEINAITLDARASYDHPATLKDVRAQLYKGGVRLAEILNSIFDHP